jgi:hypothetical protein
MRARSFLVSTPASRSRSSAATLVSASSISSTGSFAAASSFLPKRRTRSAASPRVPSSPTGSPSTSRSTPSARAISAICRTAARSFCRVNVVSGKAKRPSGSETARPIRDSPKSIPR